MRVLILAQSATLSDIRILIKSLPESTECTLLSGSNVIMRQVHLVKTESHNPKSLSSRLKCWLAYGNDVLRWARTEGKNEKFDLIYANSNPPINSFLGSQLRKKYKAPFIYMNWDIYPQIVEETYDNIFIKFICSLWHKWNNRTYPQIDQMLTIGRVMAESINHPLQKNKDIHIVPIACDTEFLKPIPKEENVFIRENFLEDKFIVLYSGKLGYGHNIAAILGAAKILEEYDKILFVFIGKGPRCAEVERDIKSGAANVRLFPYQPLDKFPFSMASGDIGIVSQEEKLAHLFLPSKAYSMMACGMPIIGMCSERDDLNSLIKENNAGIPITHATAEKVAEAVLELYKNKSLREKMGKNARKTIEEKYSENAVSEKYRNEFLRVLKR